MEKAIEVLKSLKSGNEVEIEGRIFVWLDNHVVSETSTHQNVIDGLAIKSKMFKRGQDYTDLESGTDYYTGFGDIGINAFVNMCENIPEQVMKDVKLHNVIDAVLRDRHKSTLKGNKDYEKEY